MGASIILGSDYCTFKGRNFVCVMQNGVFLKENQLTFEKITVVVSNQNFVPRLN